MKEINVPTRVRYAHSFAGLVNYYRDMWLKRAHALSPLTKLCSTKVKFKWTDVDSDAFISMKKIVGRDVLLSYPKFIEIFIIHTGARKTQLQGVMSQNGRPIAFYSRKLTPPQINYTTTERELLSITETLKYFCIVL